MSPLPVPRRTRKTILLVEDDRDLREALCGALEDSGVHVACAGNGREALDYLHRERPPCLVLLDLLMPVMNGWEFRAEQVKDPQLARIPVAVLSADSRIRPKAQALGTEKFLRKPIQLDELLLLVEECC